MPAPSPGSHLADGEKNNQTVTTQEDVLSLSLVLQRLRLFLFVLSGMLCLGSAGELWLIDHTESPVQWLPFVLCGAGVIVVAGALLRPQRQMLLALRIVMGLVVLGSAFGVYEHLANNFAFELEIRPNAVVGDVWLDALGGANPLLAPAALGVAALLALAATYQHPVLAKDREH